MTTYTNIKMLNTYFQKLGGKADESLGENATNAEIAIFDRLLELYYEGNEELLS